MKTLSLWFPILAAALLPASAKTVRLALIAGHNRGLDSDPRLQYAESDAQKMAELLVEAGGVEEDDVVLLKSPRPEDLDRAFEDIRAKGAAADPADEVVFLFYYSGHGTGTHLKLGRKEYPLQELKERIDHVPAKLRIGILDACQSGAITRLKGARLVEPFVVENKLKTEGSVLIASSAPDENAQESDQLQGSFFTHNLMSALRGAGDVSGDRRVTLMEAYQYAFHKTLVETEDSRGGAQHPMAALDLDVQGDVVLTDLNSGRGGLSFKPELDGDLLVADAKSLVMAEFHKEKGKDAFLALPPGTYRVFRKDGRKTSQFKARLKDKEIRDVGAEDLSSGFQFVGLAKGGSGAPNQEVALPWSRNDWPEQFPFQVGAGWLDSFSKTNLALQAGYRFLPKLGVFVGYNIFRDYYRKLFDDYNLQELRLGLETGKFLGENIEFTGTLFHRAQRYYDGAWETVPDGSRVCGYDSAGVAQPCYDFRPAGSASWHWGASTGATFGARLWIWNRVSFEISYGTELVWRTGKFTATDLMLMPALHW